MADNKPPNLQPYQAVLLELIGTAFELLRGLLAIVAFGILVTWIGVPVLAHSVIVIIMSLMLAVHAYLTVRSAMPVYAGAATRQIPSILVATVTVFSCVMLSNFARQLVLQILR